MSSSSYSDLLKVNEEKAVKQVLSVVKNLQHERDEYRKGAVELAAAFEKAIEERDKAIAVARRITGDVKRLSAERKKLQSGHLPQTARKSESNTSPPRSQSSTLEAAEKEHGDGKGVLEDVRTVLID